MFNFDYANNELEVIAVCTYTSRVKNCIFKINTFDEECHKGIRKHPNVIAKIKEVMYILSELVHRSYPGCGVNTNKIAFLVEDKFTGERYFIGQYDGEYSIGESCNIFGGYVFNIREQKHTGYIEFGTCYASGMVMTKCNDWVSRFPNGAIEK